MSEELGGLIPLLFVLVFLPGLCVAVTRQAIDSRIERNASVGIRTRATKASDEGWTAGHLVALPVVKTMWPVAGVGVVAAVAVQITAGGAWGIGVAFLALIVQAVILGGGVSALTQGAPGRDTASRQLGAVDQQIHPGVKRRGPRGLDRVSHVKRIGCLRHGVSAANG